MLSVHNEAPGAELSHPVNSGEGGRIREKVRSISPHLGNVCLSTIKKHMAHSESYKQLLQEAFDIPKWRKIHRLLDAYSKEHPDFFFVQIGSNDGISGDPVRENVLKHNWSGLLVEPVPHIFDRLKANYAGRVGLAFANVAVSDYDGVATMMTGIELPNGQINPVSQLSSLDTRVLERNRWRVDNIDDLMSATEVRTVTLSTLFDQFHVDNIDGLFIDTEGHDKTVLDQVDLTAMRPQFILYEHDHLANREQFQLQLRLEAAGYDLTLLRSDTFAALAA